ncbi:MAG TPA: right-handed parallel beta-helix repeat-containing protein [Gemmataceae bacterium]|nr:right-handed parallel beta-helix repeat-containing protein [Gemmataceae bacterium]
MGNQTGVSFSGFGIKNTVIGGTEAGAGNVISGNSDGLELLSSSGTLVEGNYIGTDITGTKAVANSRGILCETANNTIGGTASGAGNVISGNLNNGVELDQGATGNLVQGNRIGTDVTGIVALGNEGVGIAISSSGNTIGGTTVDASNVISANQAGGIEIFTGSANLVQGNLIGTDASGTVALGNFVGVIVTNLAGGNTIGGTMPEVGNVISGNQTTGVLLSGSDTSVQGNLIGTDITGTKALGNQNGLVLPGSNNIVGGTATGARNVISGNVADGVLSGGTDQVIEGNYIGTDITGTQALGNGGDGISAGSNTTIGVAGAGNLISANGGNGISLAGTGNLVQGNSIGTDITGTQALGNGDSGVSVTGSNNTIGGMSTGAGNLLSANGGDGIDISGAGNVVQGNLIGTDVSGTAALGNGGDGIAILNGSDNTVGGTTSAAANVISANGGSGVLISGASAMSNLISGNFIGTDLSATIHLGNAVDGVTIQDASNNTIGGTAAGAGNTIVFNGNDGVLVDTGTGNAILSDLIFANGNLGIELINNGNDNQAAPRLLSAVQTGSGTMIVGMLRSTPNTTFTVQLFSDPNPDPSGLGEGQHLLGTFTVMTNPAGIATFVITIPSVVPTGQIITATATDPNNNTSEFSSPAEVKW